MDQANLWTRRSKDLDLKDSGKSESSRSFGPRSAHGKTNPFNAPSSAAVKSPGAGASAFGLGTGAFASFGQAKTPKTPGAGASFDFPNKDKDRKEKEKENEPLRSQGELPSASSRTDQIDHNLRNTWNIFYRPPTTSRDKDYEKSIIKVASVSTVEGFWTAYTHLKRPSLLPTVSDYHIFKDGIRPVWEDDANKKGGKWIIRLKKGVADRYWEDLLLAIAGDQFMEASDEVCGAVLSNRSGEDVLSIWTKNNGGRNVKIRSVMKQVPQLENLLTIGSETIKRVLAFPPDTNIIFRSHDESIEQRKAVDEARQQKSSGASGAEKKRTSLYGEENKGKPS
ncbi:hypothetical protein LTS08_000985 [Lithohypha guttulata]|uniref:uncharacterized protein n=1 Tax=Lithohypha guttulata TaxID=1690604 RepID=UPI002DDE1911|nr:hypothetical protein LTS08_000985 [Lithohypha guttulata]